MEFKLFLWQSFATPSLTKWLGKNENIRIAQEALYQRSKFNSEATSGKYNSENENKI